MSSRHEENLQLWSAKAEFWDNMHGDTGNSFHNLIVEPCALSLLGELKPGERVLDICCGNGVLARKLAVLGCDVVAADWCEEFVRLAEERTRRYFDSLELENSDTPRGQVEFKVADATDEDDLARLGEQSFDIVLCSMAIQDLEQIAPLFRGATRLLKADAGSRFVFVTQHPAFWTNNPVRVFEKYEADGKLITKACLKLSEYLNVNIAKGIGSLGEPNLHFYYHRTLSELLNTALESGLVLDRLEEPASPPPETPAQADRPGMRTLRQFPQVLGGRFKVPYAL